jgi:hypothetical protein
MTARLGRSLALPSAGKRQERSNVKILRSPLFDEDEDEEKEEDEDEISLIPEYWKRLRLTERRPPLLSAPCLA